MCLLLNAGFGSFLYSGNGFRSPCGMAAQSLGMAAQSLGMAAQSLGIVFHEASNQLHAHIIIPDYALTADLSRRKTGDRRDRKERY